MFSIVCVYNNKEIFESWLLKSLKDQSVNFELITLDNIDKKFKSAAEALNYGGKKAKGEYILFVHQDVNLCSATWLEKAENMINSIPNLGISGVAGKCEHVKGVMTIMEHDIPPKLAGKRNISKPTKIQTLDECLFIIPKYLFDILQFDENTCEDWHLYAVDYCLSVAKYKKDTYVIPMHIYHRSQGMSFSKYYYLTLRKVLKKHKKEYRYIYTTCGDWNTSTPIIFQRFVKNIKGGISIIFNTCHF